MQTENNILTDSHKREHSYLRISLIERCNLRCTYCMPENGIALSPRSHLMTYEEIYQIASTFVRNGVTKIRLTGGEPLIRKDIDVILKKLASLNVELSITTNAILVDRFVDTLKENGIRNINASLDSLDSEKFKQITRRDNFKKVFDNIHLLIKEGFHVKLNVVLIKDFNENEIIDFINLTKDWPIVVRFIEFMPFNGNKWDVSKLVSYESIMNSAFNEFSKTKIIRLKDAQNDTSKNYKVSHYTGSFAVISTVTNPFCDSCNRLRLTANGQLKNCLFSSEENDLLTQLREGKSIEGVIQKSVLMKKKIRNGLTTNESFSNKKKHSENRSMIAIGG
ncbi:MAG: GTP 3',8-cyclase MoaA [Crocinitomicaceae bacterium]|nr:GTP 3',8-cyclase MoaA [Crocinitomicaceae bacterium]